MYGRNISTVVGDPISECSGPNREETFYFSFREAFREALISFSLIAWVAHWHLLLFFPFMRTVWTSTASAFAVWIQREVIGKEKKETVLMILWNLSFCHFLSYVPSDQAKFEYYFLLKKERTCYFHSSHPCNLLHEFPFHLLATLPPLKYIVSFFFLVWVWFFGFFFLFIFSHPTDQAAAVGYCGSGTFP